MSYGGVMQVLKKRVTLLVIDTERGVAAEGGLASKWKLTERE